jgi:hypothetical protein
MGIDEKAQVYADRDWWRSAGDVLGLELRGWTFRNEASFADKETGRPVEVPGWLTERIIAYESAKQKEAEGWRDIASAPKDGTPVLLTARGGQVGVCVWIRQWLYHGVGATPADWWDEPSHWRPLPEPPEAA